MSRYLPIFLYCPLNYHELSNCGNHAILKYYYAVFKKKHKLLSFIQNSIDFKIVFVLYTYYKLLNKTLFQNLFLNHDETIKYYNLKILLDIHYPYVNIYTNVSNSHKNQRLCFTFVRWSDGFIHTGNLI